MGAANIDYRPLLDMLKSPALKNESMLRALAHLAEQVKEHALEYQTILSDDASGRLASLFLARVINKRRKEVGERKSIPVHFIASGRHENPNQNASIAKFLNENKSQFGRSLVVTDYIEKGESIQTLIKILKDCGVEFDIAAVSIVEDPQSSQLYGPEIKEKVKFSGAIGYEGKTLYNASNVQGLSGVAKMRGHYHGQNPPYYPSKAYGYNAQKVRQAREDIQMLADELYKQV